jgi:lysophospholipase L1-like esterase
MSELSFYDLTYDGPVVQAILDTAQKLRTDGYIFMGAGTPSTVPGTPTERVWYLCGPGTYANFGASVTVPEGSVMVASYANGTWTKVVIAINGGAAVSGWKVVDSVASLPSSPEDPSLGWIVDNVVYLYVAEGGDTLSGKYQSMGDFQGPQGADGAPGPQGPAGLDGISIGDNWTAFSALNQIDGKTYAEKQAMVPDGNAVDELGVVRTTVDLTHLNEAQISSSSSKTWANTYKGIFLPVKGGDVYGIQAQSNHSCIIIPLKNCAFKNGVGYASNIATGFADRVITGVGEEYILTVPPDCSTLYIQTTSGSGSIAPTSVVRVEKTIPLDSTPTDGSHKAVTSVGVWVQGMTGEGLDVDSEVSSLFLSNSMIWQTSPNTRTSRFYIVSGGEHLHIKANTTNPTYFAFLISKGTMANNTQPTMTSARYSLSASGEMNIVVPNGSNYIWVCKASSDGDHLPQVLNKYVPKDNDVEVVAMNKLAKALVYPGASVWTQASGRYTTFIPVDGDTEYILEGNESQATYYYIVKSASYVIGSTPDFATGESVRHALYSKSLRHLTTPSDARFIAIMTEYNDTDISPKAIKKVIKFDNGILYGKKVLFVGDSVTWSGKMTDAFQQKTKCILYNRGHSGTTVADYDGTLDNAFVNRVEMTANEDFWNPDGGLLSNTAIGFPSAADIIIMLGGVNDWARVRRAQQFSLGDVTAANSKTTYAGAWKYLLSSIKTKYPQAKIILLNMYDVWNDEAQTTLRHSEVTLTNGSDISGGYSVISMTTTGQTTPVSFDDLRDVVEKVAKLYGCDCIDLRGAGFSAFVSGDRTTYYNNADGLHVNTKGGEMIADFIIARCFGG